jgi:hypothetical protein
MKTEILDEDYFIQGDKPTEPRAPPSAGSHIFLSDTSAPLLEVTNLLKFIEIPGTSGSVTL